MPLLYTSTCIQIHVLLYILIPIYMYTKIIEYIVRGVELTTGQFDLYSSFFYPAPHILYTAQFQFTRHSLAPCRTISYT